MKPIYCDMCETRANPLLQIITYKQPDSADPKKIYNTYEVWCMCSRCHLLVHSIEPSTEIRAIIGTTPILPGLDITRGTI